ncbi:phage protein Gp27 family protein [Vibrio cholerae]
MAGAKNFVLSLSGGLKEALDTKIRESAYGRSTEIAAWLEEQGVSTSRSAVARYEQALRKFDGINDIGGSMNAVVKSSVPGGELAMLFQELGELEYRRAELLDQIRDLME